MTKSHLVLTSAGAVTGTITSAFSLSVAILGLLRGLENIPVTVAPAFSAFSVCLLTSVALFIFIVFLSLKVKSRQIFFEYLAGYILGVISVVPLLYLLLTIRSGIAHFFFAFKLNENILISITYFIVMPPLIWLGISSITKMIKQSRSI